MEIILGIKGPNFVMLAADATYIQGFVVLKDDEQKIFPFAKDLMITATGNSGDASEFIAFMKANLAFYRIRNGYELNQRAVAHFARRNIADYSLNLGQYSVNVFLAGYNKDDGPMLYYIDDYGNGLSVNHGAQGYGSVFCTSIFDRYWHKDISQEEAYDIFKKITEEFQKRFVVNYKKFYLKVVDENGVRDLDPITLTT